jgi:hypothetical protein
MTEDLKARYQRFAVVEARGRSPLYEAFALGVAGDPAILAFLASLPVDKQQPNLLFAVVRFVCGTPNDFADFRHRMLSQAGAVRMVMQQRRTQTNEPARCAVLLPLLARLPEPLALIEVGASAGLCLLPDRYGYDYGGAVLPGAPMLPCRASAGVPLPSRKPEVAWRVGLDLDPVDLGDPDAVAWLEALVWPDQPERLARLKLAIAAARAEPPRLVRGDLRSDTLPLLEQARPFGTVVVFHTAVLGYLPDKAERLAFGQSVQAAGAVWISNEAAGILPWHGARKGAFLLAMNGTPVAWTDPHGGWIEWIS